MGNTSDISNEEPKSLNVLRTSGCKEIYFKKRYRWYKYNKGACKAKATSQYVHTLK